MIIETYRKMSIRLVYTTLIVMLVSTFSFALFKGAWLETLILFLYGFIAIVLVAMIILLVMIIKHITLEKQNRSRLVTTALITLANIPILAVFACIQLYLVLINN